MTTSIFNCEGTTDFGSRAGGSVLLGGGFSVCYPEPMVGGLLDDAVVAKGEVLVALPAWLVELPGLEDVDEPGLVAFRGDDLTHHAELNEPQLRGVTDDDVHVS